MSSFLPISLLTIPISSDIEHTHTHKSIGIWGRKYNLIIEYIPVHPVCMSVLGRRRSCVSNTILFILYLILTDRWNPSRSGKEPSPTCATIGGLP